MQRIHRQNSYLDRIINTKSNTKLSLNVFDKWRESRSEKAPDFHLMNSKKMGFWLEQLVVEVRKLDGTEYSSIYLILCGLHRHLGENGIYDKNFLDEKIQKCVLC